MSALAGAVAAGLPAGALQAGALPAGVLLPSSVLESGPFAVLLAFVAINTVMYGALAIVKVLPKVYPSGWLVGRNRRAQNRSIHPDQADLAFRAAVEANALDGDVPSSGTRRERVPNGATRQ